MSSFNFENRCVAIIGRFQPFHWGHFEYLMEAAQYGSELLVGITNPTPDQTRHSAADAVRSSIEANPFSYNQRCLMIADTLNRLAPLMSFRFTPCDLRSPALLRESLGICDLVAVTIYDEWGGEKKAVIEEAGYDVKVLWRRKKKLVTGTEIRRLLSFGLEWDHLVPSGTANVLRRSTLDESHSPIES